MLSIPHMIIIFIVALVFFGPEKLPELARTLGKVMAEFKRTTGDFRSTFEEHLRELEREADQRRIGQAASATPAAAPPAVVKPEEPGTDTSVPAEPVAGAVPAKAPWEQAADTAADATKISPDAPGSPETQPEDPSENTSASAPDAPAINPDSRETPDHHSEASPEPPVHDDLLT